MRWLVLLMLLVSAGCRVSGSVSVYKELEPGSWASAQFDVVDGKVGLE